MSNAYSPIRSPWSGLDLSKIAIAELAGLQNKEVSRADAMKVPAVSKGRDLICGTLSRYPLSLWQVNPDDPSGDLDVRLAPLPWMTSTTSGVSPLTRMLWTLDDLIFSGLSVWATERDGDITDAIRVEPCMWTPDPDSTGVLINGVLAKDDEVIIFEGPKDGLLNTAAEAIEASRDMARAWRQRVKSPIPLVAFKQTEDNLQYTPDEVDDFVLAADDARELSSTAFVPYGFDLQALGTVEADLFIEARNAERIDFANYLNIPAALLDGSMATATLTYSTQEGHRNEFVDYSLSFWANAVEARLSQDDVTPEGTYVRFDISWLTNPVQNGRNPGSED